ncbi:MAG: nucleoside-diphosphate sugar epimerase/dehydratase [Phycisphaerae bacterium]|nr:nucleoside-diphosphate sugar epimerase/dehydratase [Phycisphaerae bacterium]MDD5380899.1 nucleoside-diphosphate sugar epimerase/dehydratase [Phycisphaerae bacterium]
MPDSNENSELKNKNTSELSMLPTVMRYRKFLIIFAHIVAFAISLMLAFLVANNMQLRREWLIYQYPPLLFFFIIIKLMVFGFFKQYRGWWRYVGISDLIGILRASLVSTLIIVALWTILLFAPTPIRQKLQNVTFVGQSVFMADLFTTFLLLAGLRLLIRLYHEEFRTVESGRLKRLLIVGAGNTGVTLLGDIHKKQVAEYEVIGFIDDDPHKQDTFILGMPVLGTVEELPKICKDHNIEEIAIAMPSASHRQRRRVVQVCEGIKIRFHTVPAYSDIVSGKLKVSQIRDVEINDLLGREAVELDLKSIETFLKNKVIFVSGAGGSIGSEMCRQVSNFGPKLLLLVEQAENPLFYIERELRFRFPDLQIKAIICDITDKIRVNEIFDKYKPEVVIHAAAHKHVPLMELNPGEAIKNNIVGTQTVANAADSHSSTNFVMISTDKAVNPTSIMGSSKRIAEMYVQDLAKTSKTQFVTVRFGNVLDSEGSVVPIFKKQIAEGGPVTVTHPDMKRYFMTIPEASQLVLQAATMGKGGEIFVLDMGEPVKIVDLAKELITLSGFSPEEDIEIKFTGVRPGEKLFEELTIVGEDMQPTSHPKIAIWKNIIKDREKLRAGINELVTIAKTGGYNDITKKIKELVPNYIGENNNSGKH